ncbi:unnamed protein product [Camellia sinensis]
MAMASESNSRRSGSSSNGGETRKIALITGITGQDGSYLTEFLLKKGYEVHGLIRRSSNFNTQRINHIYIDPHNSHKALMKLHYGDLSDASSLRRWLDTILPDEVYNLAAQSHVAVSFEIPDYTADVVATGALRLLEAVRSHISATGRSHIKYYQAGSSEMFGSTPPPQSESTPFHPRSPYAASKCAAHWYTVNYREAYGIFACNGILFNHESPRRGENFVTRKITRAVGRIKIGLQSKLFLGNLMASRDWGFAGDYVEAMWMMLQQDKPDDYVVATEESHTVQEFLEVAFGSVGLNWRDHVVIDKRYFRPTEVDNLKGDASKAKEVLGWKPKVGFQMLVKMMVDEDIELAKREKVLVDAGFMDAQQQPCGWRDSFGGAHEASSGGSVSARPNLDRVRHDAPDRGRGRHIPPRRQPFPPEEGFNRPFVGRHFDDPYFYDDIDQDRDYMESSRLRPRLDYSDPAVPFRTPRYQDSYGAGSSLYSHDYYGSDYGNDPPSSTEGTNSVKLVNGVAVVQGRTRSLVERFERRERLNSDEVQAHDTTAPIITETAKTTPMLNRDPQITGRELTSSNDGDLTEDLIQNHDVYLSTLRSRLTKLQVLRHFWDRNDINGAIDAVRKLPDHSVQDLMSILMDKMVILTLDLFSCLLPVLLGLLDSKIER